MKELSIEEKAKRYDEALAKAAKIHRNYKGRVRAVDVVIEEVFPELKESEDERIRKRICKLLWDNAPYEEAQEYITWLEKQGNINPTEDELEALRMAAYEPTKNWSEKLQSLYEKLTHCEQKPVNKAEPKFEIGDNIEPIDTCLGSPRTIYKICDGFYETNQGTLDFEFENNWRLIEQKPAWSEEDERIYRSIMYSFAHNYPLTVQQQEFVKSIKERVQLQPKQEWTEEDELIIKRIDSLLYSINESEFEDIHTWLEFLKNRVQPKQEWSKEDEGYYDAIIAKLEVTREDALLTDNEMDFLKSLEGRVLPKSTWNEEDITKLKSAITLLQNPLIACDEVNDGVRIKTVDWLKSIENKVLLQSKQEWSEKDKHMLQKVIDFMNHPDLIKATPTLSKSTIDWLKFLEEKYTWKPSEEQMIQLKKYCPDNRPLTLLYEQLKKLINEK